MAGVKKPINSMNFGTARQFLASARFIDLVKGLHAWHQQ